MQFLLPEPKYHAVLKQEKAEIVLKSRKSLVPFLLFCLLAQFLPFSVVRPKYYFAILNTLLVIDLELPNLDPTTGKPHEIIPCYFETRDKIALNAILCYLGMRDKIALKVQTILQASYRQNSI